MTEQEGLDQVDYDLLSIKLDSAEPQPPEENASADQAETDILEPDSKTQPSEDKLDTWISLLVWSLVISIFLGSLSFGLGALGEIAPLIYPGFLGLVLALVSLVLLAGLTWRQSRQGPHDHE